MAQAADYRFLLVGKTGSGKSSTGNSILGAPVFTVDGLFCSVTDTCQLQRRQNLGKVIEILDSPGLFDTGRSGEEVAVELVRAAVRMRPGPHCVLYVVPLARYTPEMHAVYTRLHALFDASVSSHVIVIFTGGDALKPGDSTAARLVSAPDSLKQVIAECGRRHVTFNNMAADKEPQVRELLAMVDTMLEQNGGKPYTPPQYGEVETALKAEVERRLAEAEAREVQGTRHAQKLKEEAEATQRAAQQEIERLKREEEQRERERKREEERRRKEAEEAERLAEQQRLALQKAEEEKRRLQQQIEEQRKAHEAAIKEQQEREEEARRVRARKEEEARQLEEQRRKEEEERKEKELQDQINAAAAAAAANAAAAAAAAAFQNQMMFRF